MQNSIAYSVDKFPKNSEMITKKLFTLVFVKNETEILLGLKTRGLGVGLWNGFGGKVEKTESVIQAAKRELKEECNLTAEQLRHIGIVAFEEDLSKQLSIVHIFTTHSNCCRGNLESSEEMNPIKWFRFEDIPYDKMWPDAKYWYSLMLNEKYFSAIVKYDVYEKIKDRIICECDSLENVIKNIEM